MSETLRWETDRIDRLLSALSVTRNRYALHCLRASPDGVESLSDVAEYVIDRQGERSQSQEDAAIALHHSTLPKLADIGVVEYDPRGQTVRYRGHPLVEELLDHTGEIDGVA